MSGKVFSMKFLQNLGFFEEKDHFSYTILLLISEVMIKGLYGLLGNT